MAIITIVIIMSRGGHSNIDQPVKEDISREHQKGLYGDAKTMDDYIAGREEYKNIYIKKASLVESDGYYRLLVATVHSTASKSDTDYPVFMYKNAIIVGPGEDIIDEYLSSIDVPEKLILIFNERFASDYELEG